MGLFDYVHVSGPEFVCSEGHDLSDGDFQSKDFGCTMGDVTIGGGAIVLDSGRWGDGPPDRPLLGRFDVYCSCDRCPCFVQSGTGNLIDVEVEFRVEVVDDAIRSITRTSPSTAEFLATTPTQPWMVGGLGPMTHGEARIVREGIWREREAIRALSEALCRRAPGKTSGLVMLDDLLKEAFPATMIADLGGEA